MLNQKYYTVWENVKFILIKSIPNTSMICKLHVRYKESVSQPFVGQDVQGHGDAPLGRDLLGEAVRPSANQHL